MFLRVHDECEANSNMCTYLRSGLLEGIVYSFSIYPTIEKTLTPQFVECIPGTSTSTIPVVG